MRTGLLLLLVGFGACTTSSATPPAAPDGESTTPQVDGGLATAGDAAHRDAVGPDAADGSAADGSAADGSAADAGPDAEGGAALPGCVMTLNGGVTASGPCTLSLGYLAATGAMTFGVVLSSQSTNSIGSELNTMTTLQARTFTQNDVAEYHATALKNAAVWQAGGGAGAGSFTLVITAPGAAVQSGGNTFYPNAKGTVDLTLAPITATGAVGTTTVHATF